MDKDTLKIINKSKKFWAKYEKQSWWKYYQIISPTVNSFLTTTESKNNICDDIIATGIDVRDMKFAVAKEIERIMDKEICICAAVLTNDGEVIRGHRHGDCIKTMYRMKLEPSSFADSQGFVTSKNRYVNREEGRILQDNASIKSADKDGYRGKTLFSEDLY